MFFSFIRKKGTVAAIAVGLLVLAAACSPSVPSRVDNVDANAPAAYPDYNKTTVPVNIAPLNFLVRTDAKKVVAQVRDGKGDSFVVKGPKVQMPIDKWRKMLQKNQGDSIYVDVYARHEGRWTQYAPIAIAVSADSIDPYISYRLIEPSYVSFEDISIEQRCLENFDARDIFHNGYLSDDTTGQCINCHSYQDYNRGGNMQMHVRLKHGGTLIVKDGVARKINLKTDSTISAGVYPSWHPTLPIIAYSNNDTGQNFHSLDTDKIEVQDSQSDIILYNTEDNTVSIIANAKDEFETFPYWSADGNWLYYATAKVPVFEKVEEMQMYELNNYQDIKYDLMRLPFDKESMTFGPVDTIFMASDSGMSATFPRESRDGRFLMFTMAPYGTFHIWHHDADLYLMDLSDRSVRPLDEINSDDTESYHSFSSNGRWVIFSSRRDDGSYTRLYISHFDEDGNMSKPFVLPQKDPTFNTMFCKSFNIPEFMAEPVEIGRCDFLKALERDAQPVRLKNK